MLSRRSRAVTAIAVLLTMGAASGATELTREVPVRAGSELAAAGTVTLDPVLGPQERPNIVVIMADDMRDDELEHMPRTRELLGDEGVRFVNSFSPHPMCCPARASFLTGQYTHNHQVWSNRGPFGGFAALDDSATLPVRMSRAGYHTVFLGKYLNGYGHSPLPDGSPSDTYVPPGWTDWRAATAGIYSYFNTTMNINGTPRTNRGWYQTRMLGNESEDIISQYARSPRPFFLWASYVAPHVGTPIEKDDPVPIEQENGQLSRFLTPARPADARDLFDATITRPPGDPGEADVSDKPFYIRSKPPVTPAERAALTEVTRQRAEALWVLDQEVERTMTALERVGELDNTLVLFTSDNGYLLGEHRVRQGKRLPYEPSLRVPLLVRGPNVPAGETRTDPVLTPDFAPTFLDLAGAPDDPAIDGVSFLDPDRAGDPVRDTGWARAILTETGPRSLLTATEDGTLAEGANKLRFTQGARTARYLYVEHATGEKELYDQRSDPEQLDNLAEKATSQKVRRRMAALLDRLRDCAGDSCRDPAPRSLQR